MKKILLLTTGGTIASKKTEQGLSPQITSEEVLSHVSIYKEFCTVDLVSIFNIDSTNMQPENWVVLAKAIQDAYENYDGFVITHGTDTLAYTAAALSYLIQNSGKPIVVTGAQKPIDADMTDARKNLLDGLRFACEEHPKGVFIVFDGKVILGTRGKKVRTKSCDAFESINYPLIAFIDDYRIIHYVDSSCDRDCEMKFGSQLNPHIFLLKLFPGMEPDILDYIGQRYDAVIIESYGVGGLPIHNQRNFLEKMEHFTQMGKTAVIATQVMHEGSDAEIYEVGFKAIQNCNILQAYDMTIESAVVKMMWIMAETKDFTEIKRKFYTEIGHDILMGREI